MHIVVLITTKDTKEAQKIAKGLLNKKLVACVNTIAGVNSFFWWNGKIDKAKEVLLMAKTRKSHFSKIVKEVKRLHSYDVPEVIALPVAAGNQDYLKWIEQSI